MINGITLLFGWPHEVDIVIYDENFDHAGWDWDAYPETEPGFRQWESEQQLPKGQRTHYWRRTSGRLCRASFAELPKEQFGDVEIVFPSRRLARSLTVQVTINDLVAFIKSEPRQQLLGQYLGDPLIKHVVDRWRRIAEEQNMSLASVEAEAAGWVMDFDYHADSSNPLVAALNENPAPLIALKEFASQFANVDRAVTFEAGIPSGP